jgi:hypothetical protein
MDIHGSETAEEACSFLKVILSRRLHFFGHVTPLEALNKRKKNHPDLFKKISVQSPGPGA